MDCRDAALFGGKILHGAIHPNLVAGISDKFLPLKFTDGAGPIIVAVEKAAINFDPPGTEPETDAEWEVVAESIGTGLVPRLQELLRDHDIIWSTESGVMWRHLELTAALLADMEIRLQTQADYMLRNSSWGGVTSRSRAD